MPSKGHSLMLHDTHFLSENLQPYKVARNYNYNIKLLTEIVKKRNICYVRSKSFESRIVTAVWFKSFRGSRQNNTDKQCITWYYTLTPLKLCIFIFYL